MKRLEEYPFIDGLQSDSFARYTIDNRFPKILHDIVLNNDYSEEVNKQLNRLSNSISEFKVSYLQTPHSRNSSWDNFYNRYNEKFIYEVPFFFAEVYFYEWILATTHYFTNNIDPFAISKKNEIIQNERKYKEVYKEFREYSFNNIIHYSLTGNSADLSQISDRPSNIQILQDHTEKLSISLQENNTCHIILDNSATELFSDLILCYYLLENHEDLNIFLYPKARPILVSDATSLDIVFLINYLGGEVETLFNKYLKNERLQIVTIDFWNYPSHFTELKNLNIKDDDLLISKGDANYRRFFEDRRIPVDFIGGAILSKNQYAIRTLKSEIIAGIDPSIAQKAKDKDVNWLINGSNAIVQKIN